MSEGQGEGQEKSFDPTEAKIRKSREKGDTPQSTETHTFFLYVGFVITVLIAGSAITTGTFDILSAMLARPDEMGAHLLGDRRSAMLGHIAKGLTGTLSPVFLIPMAFVLASLIIQQSIVFAPEKIKPKLSKISIISNAKQKYGMNGLVEFGKKMAKMMFIAVIAGVFFYQAFFALPALSSQSAQAIMPELRMATLKLTLFIMLPTALIALIDWPYSRFSYLKKLRMSFQEIKDENKESEGDPYMKQERRARAAAISQGTMLRDVKTADVVVVNPTHYAVALKWDRDSGAVPVCVAKGVDDLAARIREQAEKHNIPIHSDPPCARSLHATVEIGEAIRPEHYAAVAAAIHFADKLRSQAELWS